MVNITIDGIHLEVENGTTILDAAKLVGIQIPTLCYMKELNEIGACRVCVVEVEGIDRCVTACNNYVQEGMVIHTNSPKARNTRITNTKLILSEHDAKCASCVRSGNCALQKLGNDLNILYVPYDIAPEKNKWDYNFPLVREADRCIKCMRCVQICDKVQDLHVWDVLYTGSRTTVGVRENKKIHDVNCSLCGQCIKNCPVGALRSRGDVDKVLDAVANPELVTVVQIAPAVRAAWGENLGFDKAAVTPGKMVNALKMMGFDYVFDTNFSADLTIMEEGSEFLERLSEIKQTGLPMFTSCCPGWVRFVKSEFPEFYNRLSTAKSPQQMFGAVSKNYFAEKMGIDPDKIYNVSIMPCVAKKDEMTWDGGKDIDAVLTTREFERICRMHFLDVDKLVDQPFDSPLGTGTGAAVIFGATGGVMEAALRSAYYLVKGENPDPDVFQEVRGLDGWKEATFAIDDIELKVAVVSGLGNTRKLIHAIKEGDVHYDFVEVMTCPGGCVNGGGQPIHLEGEDIAARCDVLYGLDAVNELRFSHENPEIQTIYNEYFEKPLSHKAHALLHMDRDTHFE